MSEQIATTEIATDPLVVSTAISGQTAISDLLKKIKVFKLAPG